MLVGCTQITGLKFDMFSTSIAKILGGTLLSVWLFLQFFRFFVLSCFVGFCLSVCLFFSVAVGTFVSCQG